MFQLSPIESEHHVLELDEGDALIVVSVNLVHDISVDLVVQVILLIIATHHILQFLQRYLSVSSSVEELEGLAESFVFKNIFLVGCGGQPLGEFDGVVAI
jgi:hypothetical protein